MKRRKTIVRNLLGVLLPVCLLALSLVRFPVTGNPVFSDANLKAALQKQLGTTTITAAQMEKLTVLDLSGCNITSLNGLESAKNLTNLSLRENQIADLSALSGMTKLETLDITGNRVASLSPLTALSSLRVLQITDNEVTSLVPVEKLKKLQILFCENNYLDLSSGSAASASRATLEARGTYVVAQPQKETTPPDSGSSDPGATELKVKDGKARIDRSKGILCGITLGTDVSQIFSIVEAGGNTLRVLASDGSAATGQFCTGMTVQLLDSSGKVLDSLAIVLYGDVNGNGETDIGDLVLVNQHVLGLRTLTGIKFEAANIAPRVNGNTSDKTVDIGDLVIVNQVLLGLRTVTQ